MERLVFDTAEQHAPALISGVPADCHATMFGHLIAEILVGPTPDEVRIIWRT